MTFFREAAMAFFVASSTAASAAASLVETVREFDEGGVAPAADFVEDAFHDGLDPGRRSIAAVELLQGRSEILLVVAEDAHGGKSRRSGRIYSTTIRSVFK
jgi:hypothetical protein